MLGEVGHVEVLDGYDSVLVSLGSRLRGVNVGSVEVLEFDSKRDT